MNMGTNSRPDNFTNKHSSNVPDAGCYNHNHKGMGTGSKAANMGSKYKPIVNSNPGPGAYRGDTNTLKPSPKKIHMGSNARPDNFTNKQKTY